MKIRITCCICILFMLIVSGLKASHPSGYKDIIRKGVRINLTEDGKAYTTFSFSTQFWARNTWFDKPLQGKNELYTSEFDFALRRTRFSMLNNLDDKFVLYTQLGFNNLNRNSSRPQIYFHDAWGMFQLIPKSFYIGFGLNGWNGISRLTNTSFQKMLTLDGPGFHVPAVNRTDLEVRQLGLFAKGTVGRLSYRAAISKPFSFNGFGDYSNKDLGFESTSRKLSYKSYLAFHLFEKEYYTTPYVSMTYLGEKKILNFGAGFDFYPESIGQVPVEGDPLVKDRVLLGADVFCELPFTNKQAITFYLVLYKYDFGDNYLRSYGTMNLWSGNGNSEYKVGTGSISYSTLGYLFKKDFMKLSGRLQLFYAYSYKDFEALPVNLQNHDIGVNYYLAGQKMKFTMQYSIRPVLNDLKTQIQKQRGTLILQAQLVI